MGEGMQQQSESTERHRAVRRASRVWQECAVHVRGGLRAHGVRGELRRLDEYAAGTRGAQWLAFVADFAAHCREHGLPAETVAMHVTTATERVVLDAYDGDAA